MRTVGSMTSTGPDHPSLLPAILAADPRPGRVRRSARDWVVDVLCFLLGAGLGLYNIWESLSQHRPAGSHPPYVLDVIIGALCCGALWTRRRWPVGLALAMVPLGFLSSSSGGASCILLFTVAVHRPLRRLIPVALLNWAAALLFLWVFPDPTNSYWVSATTVSIVLLMVVAWGMFVRARRQLIVSLRERALRAESEQQLRIQQAKHQERSRIAREMHDVLAHRISLLSVHAGALEFRPDAPPEQITQAAGVIRASAHQALQDLREVIGVLRDDTGDPAPERPQPSLTDLPALIEESRQAGMAVDLDNRLADLSDVPAIVGRSAYRTVQEGLTNARKHAPGATVHVLLDGSMGKALTIEVRNPLTASTGPRIPGAGAGLIGLTERASLAGGRLAHGRTRGGDFRLRAWLPWPA